MLASCVERLCRAYTEHSLDFLTKTNCMAPSTSASPDILFRLLYYTKCQSRKREIIQSNSYRILLIVIQVIYTLDTTCEPNVMILAQEVLQIFCSQGPLWVKCLSPKREIIQSNFDRIL